MVSVRVRVSGEIACFSRPECKVERLSYEVLTPSAARGILDAICWKPEMRWHVRRIEVLKPVRFISLKRNEVQDKVAPRTISRWMRDPGEYLPIAAGAGSETATPRTTVALRDVAYVIEATLIVFSPSTENTPIKYMAMFKRRVEKGQCHTQPCLGCREFAAHFEPPRENERPIEATRDLGVMLYDIVFRQPGGSNYPLFFRARLERGVLNTDVEVALEDERERKEVLACSYKH